jgi:hypothetical protein
LPTSAKVTRDYHESFSAILIDHLTFFSGSIASRLTGKPHGSEQLETVMDRSRFASLSRTLAFRGSRRRLLCRLVSSLLAAPPAVAAQATLTFDSATGTGVIDSGSVLSALGWDAQRLQDEAKALGFVLAEKVTYTGVCSTGGAVSTTARTDTFLENEIRYDGPTITGFALTGKGDEIQWQDATQVGAICVEVSVLGSVRSLERTSLESHLYIGYKGIQVQLWPESGSGIVRDYCR